MRAVAAALATLVASLAAGAQTRSDRNGDPLPPGAIARLGSAKFVHGERIRGLSLAPDGSVALAADERQIILWDVATGRELRVFKDINAVRCAALSPDGKLVAANGVGPRIWIWDAKTGRELHELVGKIGGSETLAWSSDGKWIAASADKRVNMWDAATGELLKSFAHEIRVVRIAFAPDCKRLVTGGFAENCHTVWDIAGGKELGKLQGGPGWGFSGTAGFAPDGKSVTGYCEEKIGDVTHCSLRSWDVGTGEKLRDIDRGPCSFAGFTPGGQVVRQHQKRHRTGLGYRKR